MNLNSSKVLKSLAVLLLMLEFLTPAVLTDLLSDEVSDPFPVHALHLDLKKQQCPLPFLAENLDNEEEQREAQNQKVLALYPDLITITLHSRFPEIAQELPLSPGVKLFDTHPPLFKLHQFFLI